MWAGASLTGPFDEGAHFDPPPPKKQNKTKKQKQQQQTNKQTVTKTCKNTKFSENYPIKKIINRLYTVLWLKSNILSTISM